MSIGTLPAVEYLRECFDYDPETGNLRWRARPREHFPTVRGWRRTNSEFTGTPAGCIHHEGYLTVKIMDRRYQAHRIIWKWVTGEDPPWEIDHKDQDRANNRWVNLRRATDSEQQWNRGLRKSNTSGWRGVHWQRKWKAAILVNGVRRYLGRFATAEEASAAYEVAARKLHGEFYRPQRR